MLLCLVLSTIAVSSCFIVILLVFSYAVQILDVALAEEIEYKMLQMIKDIYLDQ